MARSKHFATSLERTDSLGEARIEYIAPRKLRPHPRNTRQHSPKQIALIEASIRKFGFLNPLLIDDDNVILCGQGRLKAAQSVGLGSVPVVRFKHLTAAQKRTYLIADNKIAELGGWDREMLAVELGELIELLPAEGLDISLTGFQAAEIDSLLVDIAPTTLNAPDLVPEPPSQPTTKRGDLWLLGRHRLLCGDARNSADFTRLMNATSAAAVFCDPPYNLRVAAIGGRGRIRHPEFAFASGEMSERQYRAFLTGTLGNGVRVSSEGAIHFVCIDWRHLADLLDVGKDLYGAMLNLVVWNKTNAGQGSFYRSQHELIGVYRVGEFTHRNNVELGRFGRNRSNVWTYPGINSFGRNRIEALAIHPTVKPVSMVADALLDCTARGDVVLDQFAGSGTIFLAAEKVGRRGYGIEYEPSYVDVAIQRWQAATKLEATLASDGRTFADICSARNANSAQTASRTDAIVNKPQSGRGARGHPPRRSHNSAR